MDISFDHEINESFIENSKGAHNNSVYLEDDILNEHYQIDNFFVLNNRFNNQNVFLIKDNVNPFFYAKKMESDLFIEDIPNQKKIYFLSFSNNNNNKFIITNINKETNLTDLRAGGSEIKKIFEIKKESIPKFFTENSINVMIKHYDISKELKSKLILDMNINYNNNIEQIKRVLESDTKKRRKTCKNSLYRTDHILIKLINIIDSSLFNFINNLIASLFSKEKIYHLLDGVISSNQIDKRDLKVVIKKNDYIIRSKLETREEKLNFINLTLKKYFSFKISPKYDKSKSKYPSNYNELIFEKLLKDEDNKEIFDFILNDLLIKDWLDLLLYKTDLKDFDKYNSINKTQRTKIKENLERIDKYINKIYRKDKIYFNCFVLIAYNLSRFLMLKEKRKKTKIDEEIQK